MNKPLLEESEAVFVKFGAVNSSCKMRLKPKYLNLLIIVGGKKLTVLKTEQKEHLAQACKA